MDNRIPEPQSSAERRSVAGIARRGGEVFIARRLPGGAMGDKWEFPGGKVEPGEDDRAALRREYLEEFGVEVEAGPLAAQASFEHNGHEHGLYAYIIRMEEEPRTLSEHTGCRWIPLDGIESLDFADSDRKLIPQLRRFFDSHSQD